MVIDSPDPYRVPTCVSIVGAGRLGLALTGALREAGIEVRGPAGGVQAKRPGLPPADAVLLCVPDAEISAVAASVAGSAPLIGHTSGATGLSALAPAGGAAFGLHPLQTFAGGEPPAHFRGAGCAVAGSDPEALAFAATLAGALGMRSFPITDEARPAYHAAAAIASNYLVTLMDAAEEMAGAAGIEANQARTLLAPLVASTVENWAALGPERALTGPLARGDESTVEAQRRALEGSAPDLLPLFDALADRTRLLASRKALA